MIVPESNQGLCLQVENGKHHDGAAFELGHRSGATYQNFRFCPDQRAVICVHSNSAMDIGKDPKRGPNIIQWRWHGRSNQRWIYDASTLRIRACDQGFVLDVKGGSVRAGAHLLAAPESGSATQRWILVNIPNPGFPFQAAQYQAPAFAASDPRPDFARGGHQGMNDYPQYPY
jgi:hypothetical protein